MTNLICAVVVSVVTNTSEQVITPVISLYGCAVFGCQTDHYKEAQDAALMNRTRLITTVAKKITTLKFDWNGPREILSEEILWQTNQVLKLELEIISD